MLKKNAENLELFAGSFSLDSGQKKAFEKYIELLETWSERTNLVSTGDITKFVNKHCWESLLFYDEGVFVNRSLLIDIGSGGGFPGIPLKIVYPEINMLLLDSKRKKVLFLKEVIDCLSLKDASAICSRVEDVAEAYKNNFDIVTARAVAEIKITWAYSRPILKEDGCLVSVKGGDVDREIYEVKKFDVSAGITVENIAFSQSLNDFKRIVLKKKASH
jgi:16S rRNA (guanine527-N7)-methyltransferase